MSDLPPSGILDGAALQSVARVRGVRLTADEAERIAAQAGPLLEDLRRLAATLCADDDMLAFRRLLEEEGARE